MEVGRLEADVDGTWDQEEIDRIAAKWLSYRGQLDEGTAIVGISFAAGRPGYGRREKETTRMRAARSISLHAGGVAWTKADAQVADEVNRARRQQGDARFMPDTTIGVYRKRARDRRP